MTDAPLTRTEFDTKRRALGISQREFAKITGTHANTVYRWGKTQIPVFPGWVGLLLDAWIELDLDVIAKLRQGW